MTRLRAKNATLRMERDILKNKKARSLTRYTCSCGPLMDGYEDSGWLSYKQAATIGAQVKRGRKGLSMHAPLLGVEVMGGKQMPPQVR